MEYFIPLAFPIILLVILTFIFISDGIPYWVQKINIYSSTLWNFGIVAMSTVTIIIYLAKK